MLVASLSRLSLRDRWSLPSAHRDDGPGHLPGYGHPCCARVDNAFRSWPVSVSDLGEIDLRAQATSIRALGRDPLVQLGERQLLTQDGSLLVTNDDPVSAVPNRSNS